MRTRKKPSKRSIVKKLQNGGTGDPKKPVVTQSAAGFPLFKEDGELTATPTTPFYTRTDQRGYYPGVPMMLGEAEVVADSGDALGSIDKVVEDLGGGIFGDYAALPIGEREKFEDEVREAIGEAGKIALIATSPLLAIAAPSVFASGVRGFGALYDIPLVRMAGLPGLGELSLPTSISAGTTLDIVGAGMATEYLPGHIKDFIDNPSLGNAAFVGLDLVAYMPFGNAALQSYRQGLRATAKIQSARNLAAVESLSPSRAPITLASGERRTTQLALEAAAVQKASLAMNSIMKDEIFRIEQLGESGMPPEVVKKSINETLAFYDKWLSSPNAIGKVMDQFDFLDASAKAGMKGLSKEERYAGLLKLPEGVPAPPAVSFGEDAIAAKRYMENRPFFADHSIYGDALQPENRLIQTLIMEPKLDETGALVDYIPRVTHFSNTPTGRRLAAEALLETFRSGSQSAKNVILRTIDQMMEYDQAGNPIGMARGRVAPKVNVAQRVKQGKDKFRHTVEFIDGKPRITGSFKFDPSKTDIEVMDILTPEEFLSTLVHETGHNMLIPFLDQMADMQIIEMHTITSTVNYPIPGYTNVTPIENLRAAYQRKLIDQEFTTGFQAPLIGTDRPTEILTKYVDNPRLKNIEGRMFTEEDVYNLFDEIAKPQEIQARLFQIRKEYDKIATKKGIPFEKWQYSFTPKTAREAWQAFRDFKEFKTMNPSGYEADVLLDLMVGSTEAERFETLASLLNKTFFNPATLVGGTAAVATQADITGTTTQGPGLKRGGVVSKKKKRKGFRSKKAYRYGQNGTKTPEGDSNPNDLPQISQGRDRSYTEMAVDFLRALSQPRNYSREIMEGEFLPTQLELERGMGRNPIDNVVALANPFDHIYATLAMAGVIDDPNYDNEYSSAALLGLVTGSAGQKVPKALEKTVNLLKKEGVKTYSDIRSVLGKNKDSAVLNELKAIKDKAMEFSKHAREITGKAYDDVVTKTGMSPFGYGSPAKIETAATNYMIESDPDALLKFTPEKFDAGDFDKPMQNFAEEYLTSFRAVRASDQDPVVKYLTDPIGTGIGGRNLGPGLYQGTKTALLGEAAPDATKRTSYGDVLGAIRIAPEIGGPKASASEIIKDIQIGELKGSVSADYDTRYAMHDARLFPGFTTAPDIRASRSGTGVNLLDYSRTPEGRAELFDKYISDYYGAQYHPQLPRGRDLLPDFDQGGKFKVKKKGKVKKVVDPTPFMQPEMSKFIRGQAGAAQFNDDYNEILKGLVRLRDSAENGEGSKPRKESITAKDIAQLADEKAGPNAKYSFYDLMGSTYWIESRNRNIEQDAPQLNKRSRANMEGQLEPGAIKAANNYADAISKAIGKDWEGLTESEIKNPLTIPKEKRDVLSFAYMYGPEGTPTSKYLRGEVPFGEFWSKHWNRTGSPTRAAEAQKRLDATYPGTKSIFPEYVD